MLPSVMPTIPITDLRTRQPEVITAIKQSPVKLAMKSASKS